MTARENVVPVLLEKVYQLIQDKLELSHQTLVTKLAQHLFSNISDDDLVQRNESDLYGAVISLWHHINEKKPEDVSVQVFNPTVSRQGWQSTHTIVEVVVQDIDLFNQVTCEGNFYFNGTVNLNFSGYAPKIGDNFQIVSGFQGSCPSPGSYLDSSFDFDTILTAQCESDGLYYEVLDINYTTSIAWDGEGGDGMWSNPANWDPNGIPEADSRVIINLPGGDFVSTNGAGVTAVANIVLGAESTLEVNGDLLLDKYIYVKNNGMFKDCVYLK